MKIMVAHPKKPGVAAIDKDLLPESPKLKFNEAVISPSKILPNAPFNKAKRYPLAMQVL